MKYVLRTLLVLSLLALGCSDMKIKRITISKIAELEPPLIIKTVEAKFGTFNHGHGPYIWYKNQDSPDKEYWFWFSLKNKNVALEDFQIVLITLVNADDPDDFEIVWPEKLKDKANQEVFDLLYR